MPAAQREIVRSGHGRGWLAGAGNPSCASAGRGWRAAWPSYAGGVTAGTASDDLRTTRIRFCDPVVVGVARRLAFESASGVSRRAIGNDASRTAQPETLHLRSGGWRDAWPPYAGGVTAGSVACVPCTERIRSERATLVKVAVQLRQSVTRVPATNSMPAHPHRHGSGEHLDHLRPGDGPFGVPGRQVHPVVRRRAFQR